MKNALFELRQVLAAWRDGEGSLRGLLAAWWQVVTGAVTREQEIFPAIEFTELGKYLHW